MDRASSASRIRRPRSRPEPARPALPPPSARGAAPRPTPNNAGQLTTDLIAIGLFLLGGLLALGLYRPGSAGGVGAFLVQFVRFWMGHVVYAAPLLFAACALALALDYRRATSPQMQAGIALLMASVFGSIHLVATTHAHIFDSTGARLHALLGHHADKALLTCPDGGALGAVVMAALGILGRGGSYITLGSIGLASLLLIGDLTLRGIAERLHERSVIAAERARRRAAARREAREERQAAALSLPQPEAAPRRSLFLDFGSEKDEAPEKPSAREENVGGMFRRVLNRRPAERAKAEEAPAKPAPEREELALVPVQEVLPPDPPRTEAPKARFKPPASRRETPRPRPAAKYVLPRLELLDAPQPRPKRPEQEAHANIVILESTLAQFRIQAQVVEIADGPSVTRYEIRLGEGIRVKKITDLADNIAMSLAAMSVRVEAPIPGKAAIGIEVPKKHPCMVTLRECIDSPEFKDHKSRVAFVLGKDVGAEVRCADLARMPHLLVAGATNSGKSVCLNVLIASMLFRSRPDELKMIMIDPKRVELTLYEGIPHLIHPVVKDVKQAAGILRWVLKEMDRRYDLFARVMTRNIDNYNEKVSAEPERKLPFIVVIIDELADLMMQQGPEVEQSICRLAQLARATGIHLVVATQRPSVDVITGLIKANVPSRISFSVTSQIDSRTILDTKGAENLVGRGDMLFKPVDANKPMRIQGAFLRETEVEALVTYLKSQGSPEYIAEPVSVDNGAHGQSSEEEAEDELFEPAARFVVTTGHASTSMIQRKFKIGYTRAARLVDMMEAKNIVGPLDGAKPREIRMSRDSLDQFFLRIRDSVGGFGPVADEDEEEVEMEETIGPAGDEDPFNE